MGIALGQSRLSGNWRKIAITLKIPRLGYQSVSDTWGLAKVVRKVEFKLLHMMRCGMHGAQSVLSLEQQNRSSKIAADGFDFLGGRLPASP